MEIKIMNNNTISTPYIVFTEDAYYKMTSFYSAKISETKEFMFVGTVEKHIKNKIKTYIITDILLIPQESNSGAYCETDDEKYPAWLHENFPKVEDKLKVRLNGHSHVNMGVSPSGVDDNNIEKMMQYVDDFFIQLIINRNHNIMINLWDKETGLIYDNCPYFVTIKEAILKFEDSLTKTPTIVKLPNLNIKDFEATDDPYIFKNKYIFVDLLKNKTSLVTDKLIFTDSSKLTPRVTPEEKTEIEKDFKDKLKNNYNYSSLIRFYPSEEEGPDEIYATPYYYGKPKSKTKKGGKK